MINSQEYWDQRFRSGDWRENKGTEQTLFHYKTLLKYMPEWLKKEISDNKMSICDLGCGTGEGVNLFKRYFKESKVTGVDFSDYAIKEAKRRYSDSLFVCSDIIDFEKHYDVIISSHTLEHFKNSYDVFSNIINLADNYFILIIPFQEEELFKEHLNSFDYNFFPITIQGYNLVYFKEIDKLFFNSGKYWTNEQILVIYANTNRLPVSKFSLKELNNDYFNEYKLAKKRYEEKISSFEDLIEKNKNLKHILTHEQKICEDLIEKNKSLQINLTHQQQTCDKLIEKNNDTEFQLVQEYNNVQELKKLSENHLSQYLSEQKKYEDLIEKNKNLKSNLIQKQNEFQKLKELNGNLESSLTQEHGKVQELKELNGNNLSKFLSEKRKCELLIKENKAYKSRKVVKFVDKLWKIYYIPKAHSYIVINKIYKKLKRFPKITTLIHKINNKFSIINKEAALKTYRKYQNTKSEVIKDETKINKIEPNVVSTAQSIKEIKPTVVNTAQSIKENTRSSIDTEPKQMKDIKVAVILDEFSYNCFKHEFNAIIIEPSNWLKVFETEKPDLFLCESAWSGVDSIKRPWRGQIYSSVNFNYENRTTLISILDYCKKNSIPTIFWNKEDPTHYGDKVNNFVDTALKFDHIFTTSEECVQRYKKDYDHKSVHCLMFAGQPKMFNPIEKQDRTKDIVFAGSWYKHHPQRCIEMEKIFDKILDSGYKLKIYNRTHGTNDPNRIFPEKYRMLTNPAVPFNQIERVYKESIYSLNINTETKSKTMFARRVFELMLCNTLVLSNYSKGMDELFGDNVIFINNENINLSKYEEKRANNLYNVLKNHTYLQRFKQILDIINYEYMPINNEITLYYIVNYESEIKSILNHYESVTYPNKKLTLLLSKNIPNHRIKNIYQHYTNYEISVYSLNYILQKENVSSTINKLGYYHGNPQNIKELISNETPYFIFANLQLKEDFVENGILHYSYIKTDIGIVQGDKFTFEKVKDINNTIFHKSKFTDVFNSIFRGNSTEFTVYTLQNYKPATQKKLKSETFEVPKIDITTVNIPDIDIHGSCVSRDVFNFDENKEVEIGQYFARQSFVSAVSTPSIKQINVNLPSSFQKRMVESDLTKDMFEKLSLKKARYLLIDLIDERLNLIKYNNSIFTFSDELKNSKFMENFDVEVVDKLSMSNSIWKKSMDEYVNRLLEIYDEDKIIIHEAYLVESYLTRDNQKKYFPEDNRRYIKLLNRFFKKYYAYLKQKLPNSHVISISEDNYQSWEGHLWEKAPMHYENRYYQDVLKIIKNIIFDENIKDQIMIEPRLNLKT